VRDGPASHKERRGASTDSRGKKGINCQRGIVDASENKVVDRVGRGVPRGKCRKAGGWLSTGAGTGPRKWDACPIGFLEAEILRGAGDGKTTNFLLPTGHSKGLSP